MRSHWNSIACDMLTATSSHESVSYKSDPSNSRENNDLVTHYDEISLTLTTYIANSCLHDFEPTANRNRSTDHPIRDRRIGNFSVTIGSPKRLSCIALQQTHDSHLMMEYWAFTGWTISLG